MALYLHKPARIQCVIPIIKGNPPAANRQDKPLDTHSSFSQCIFGLAKRMKLPQRREKEIKRAESVENKAKGDRGNATEMRIYVYENIFTPSLWICKMRGSVFALLWKPDAEMEVVGGGEGRRAKGEENDEEGAVEWRWGVYLLAGCAQEAANVLAALTASLWGNNCLMVCHLSPSESRGPRTMKGWKDQGG